MLWFLAHYLRTRVLLALLAVVVVRCSPEAVSCAGTLEASAGSAYGLQWVDDAEGALRLRIPCVLQGQKVLRRVWEFIAKRVL